MTYGDNTKALAAFHRQHATTTDDHDGLCPECHGMGWYATPHIWYPEEDDWVEVYCFACDGTGTLAAIPTEEEASQSAYQLAGGTLHLERHGSDVMTFPWPIRPR